ncbi:hypothetical protein DIE22_26120 [Burkholderia sp. Bp9142]|nr:hypothetical protein DIE22_26120 [Burkholderia sp. Bp9142]
MIRPDKSPRDEMSTIDGSMAGRCMSNRQMPSVENAFQGRAFALSGNYNLSKWAAQASDPAFISDSLIGVTMGVTAVDMA